MKTEFWNEASPRLVEVVAIAIMWCSCLNSTAQSAPDVIWSTNAHSSVYAVAFAGNSALVASAGNHQDQVKVWDATSAALVRAITPSASAALSVALSPDSSLVATGDASERVGLWRVSDGVKVWGNVPGNYLITGLAYAPDGSRVADARTSSWPSDPGRIVLHRASDGEGTVLEAHPGGVRGVAFSPSADLLASAGADRTAILWQVPGGSVMRVLTAHSNAVNSVDFSPDGSLLATASSDGTARLWKVSDGTVLRVLEGGGGNAARFSADGRLLLTVTFGTIKVWRVADGRLLYTYADTEKRVGP